MAIQTTIPQPTAVVLGAEINLFPKGQQKVVQDLVDTLNNVIDGTITTTDLTLTGKITQSLTTDSTTKDTGAIITEGGIGVEKSIVTGGSVTAGTSLKAGTLVLGGTGAVGAPTHSFTDAATQGMYSISASQLGFAVDGVLKGGFNSSGAFTNVISEQTATVGVTVDGALIKDGGLSLAGNTATAGVLYSGTVSVSGAGTPQTLNTLVGTATFTGIADIIADGTTSVVINNSLVTASTVGFVVMQTTTAAAGSTPRVESVTYGAGTITIAIRNSDPATATGVANYGFSFILFKL